MALSDYLTSDEWDACFYRWVSAGISDFGTAIRETVFGVAKTGYVFEGVTAECEKIKQIPNTNNADKVVAIVKGDRHPGQLLVTSLVKGRFFIKRNAPSLLSEDDAKFAEILDDIGVPEAIKLHLNLKIQT